MPLIPEPTLFAAPPTWADEAQRAALFSHWAPMALGAAAALVAFARAPQKGALAHVLIGVGAALCSAAGFMSMSLYNNYLYKEAARHTGETGLFLFGGGALLVAAGVGLVPGFSFKRGAWLSVAIPALALVGFGLAGASQLPAMAVESAKILGAVGGALAMAAGGLHVFDKIAKGANPQERAGACVGFALIVSGLLVAIGAPMSRGEGVDKGTLAIAIGEGAFALFVIMGVMSVEGSASSFRKAPAPTAYVPPPPPGGYAPPPPPGAMPRPPGGTRPHFPSTPPAPSAPSAPQPPAGRPTRPSVTPPPRRPGT